MQLQAVVTAIGKRTSVFKNEVGECIASYTGNASKKYGKGRSGGYLQIIEILPMQQGKQEF